MFTVQGPLHARRLVHVHFSQVHAAIYSRSQIKVPVNKKTATKLISNYKHERGQMLFKL